MNSLFNQCITRALPWIPRSVIQEVASRYIAGETIADMLHTVKTLNEEGATCTVDLLGEFTTTPADAKQAAESYQGILADIQAEKLNANISIKLSQMGLKLDKSLCYALVHDLASVAKTTGNFIRIDMEDASCTEDTLEIYLKLRETFEHIGIVLQARLRRTLQDTRRILTAGAGNFRLCKGIYIEPREIAYTEKEIINKNYIRLLELMLSNGAAVGIATHNECLIWEAERLIDILDIPSRQYEFQMLLGVDPELRRILLKSGHRLRVYVPFGSHWYPYSLRRLKENPTIGRYIFNDLIQSHLKF